MPIEVTGLEDVQQELAAAMLSVLSKNGITAASTRLETLIGAAVGYAMSQGVPADEFVHGVRLCMVALEMD